MGLAQGAEAYAGALRTAELEYRGAQEALAKDDSDAARHRYAVALARYDRLQGMFPFVAARRLKEQRLPDRVLVSCLDCRRE